MGIFVPAAFFYCAVTGIHWVLTQSVVEEHELVVGDHVWCHVRRYFKTIQHHGIWVYFDGMYGVIHFDGEHDDKWYVYRHCRACSDRNRHLRSVGRGGRSVRFSCLACFSHMRHVYRCEYSRSSGSVLLREAGSRSTQVSFPGHVVAAVALGFLHGNNFGKYHLFTHNCEDFARFCKVGMVGSKQVRRALLYAAITTGNFVQAMAVYGGIEAVRKYQDHIRRSM